MAHLTDVLPWKLVAAQLKYSSPAHEEKAPASSLYFGPDSSQQTEALETFATSFSQTLAQHTQLERQKYPETYTAPDPDDTLLDERIVRVITPTVHRWRTASEDYHNVCPETHPFTPCPHREDADRRFPHDPDNNLKYADNFSLSCDCAVPFREWKAHAFLRSYRSNSCYEFCYVNGAGFFSLEIAKTLLLHSEMDPLLRICAHPHVDYKNWRHTRMCTCADLVEGWERLLTLALKSYLALNILQCFPELQPQSQPATTTTRGHPGDRDRGRDYRDTRVYQATLYECTMSALSEVCGQSHRQFFGIPDHHFDVDFDVTRCLEWSALREAVGQAIARQKFLDEFLASRGQSISPRRVRVEGDNFPFGKVPLRVMLGCEREMPELPHESEVAEAANLLRGTRLPEELIQQILEAAYRDGDEYEPEQRYRQLPIAHDPLHPENREELDKYLNLCWDILIRCSMFARALGEPIHWRKEVAYIFHELFRMVDGQKIKWFPNGNDEE